MTTIRELIKLLENLRITVDDRTPIIIELEPGEMYVDLGGTFATVTGELDGKPTKVIAIITKNLED